MRQRRFPAAWPADDISDKRILTDIEAGVCWLLIERAAKRPVGTLTLGTKPDAEFAATRLGVEGQPVHDALIVSRMATDRSRAGRGLGTLLLDWASDRTARQGTEWLWISLPRDDLRLQAWFISNGFEHMPTGGVGHPSGSLWRRRAYRHTYLKDQLREVAA